jgi:hypothetical protein
MLVRERVLESLQGKGDQLVAPEDTIATNVVVLPPRLGPALLRVFDAALAAAGSDPVRQHRRALLGYRVLRSSDASASITPTANLEIEVSIGPSETQTVSETRKTTRAGVKAELPNPEYAREAARATRVQAAIDFATGEDAKLTPLFSLDAPSCSTPGAGVVCNTADKPRVADALRTRQQVLQAGMAAARDALAKTQRTVTGDSTDTVDAPAKAFRKMAVAKMKVTLLGREAGAGTLATDVSEVPFAAVNFEIAAEPARGIEAKRGGPPSEEEFERAAADAMVDRIDQIMTAWMSRSSPHVDPGALDPGTRAYQVLLARHIANNRKVKLFSDVIDARPEVLGGEESQYPVQLPAGAENKCFTFVAASADTMPVDVNLTVTAPSGGRVGRDRRPTATAGFEICGLPSGAYKAAISWGPSKPRQVFLSVFESTPNVVTDADLQAASTGTPPTLGKATAPLPPLPPAVGAAGTTPPKPPTPAPDAKTAPLPR